MEKLNNTSNRFIITRADKADMEVRGEISKIFAEGFTQWLSYFSKDKDKIARAFAHMFVLDQFYVAIAENKIAGMAACTDCRTWSVLLDSKELRRHLGFIRGSIAALVLKKEFQSPYNNPAPETGSIEFVGTAIEFRGQGVASQMIEFIIENTPYREYLIEEVADTNIPAMKLYKKLGFREYKQKPIPEGRRKKIGINNLVSLKYVK